MTSDVVTIYAHQPPDEAPRVLSAEEIELENDKTVGQAKQEADARIAENARKPLGQRRLTEDEFNFAKDVLSALLTTRSERRKGIACTSSAEKIKAEKTRGQYLNTLRTICEKTSLFDSADPTSDPNYMSNVFSVAQLVLEQLLGEVQMLHYGPRKLEVLITLQGKWICHSL